MLPLSFLQFLMGEGDGGVRVFTSQPSTSSVTFSTLSRSRS